MADFIKWLILFEILGWLTFPICYKVFNSMPDRGLSISKIAGLFLVGYIYWLGNIFQIFGNNFLGVIFSIFIIAIFSMLVLRKISHTEIIFWCRDNLKIVVFFELTFIFSFFAWSFIRASNPEIIGTEKPMELAFITSIFRSPSFPPNDPWLSGYAISYYYFGYLLVSMLMRICGTSSGTAFNLAISVWFALVVVTSSGIIFNLLFLRMTESKHKTPHGKLLLISLLAPLLILIISNAEGLLEVLHSRGLFWSTNSVGKLNSPFWTWLDIQELTNPPTFPLDWTPGREGGTWWWRASRVLQDYTALGQSREIIDEFPFFSFLLADLHPHLLSMPFVLLAIYFCSSRFLNHKGNETTWTIQKNIIRNPDIWLTGLILGILLFVNTWDFPIYFGLFSAVTIVMRIADEGFNKAGIYRTFLYLFSVGIACLLLFLPFIIGLSSQAGGLLPSMIFRTRGIHFLIMFFPQLFLIVSGLLLFINNLKDLKLASKYFFIGILISFLIFFGSSFFMILPSVGTLILEFLKNILKTSFLNQSESLKNTTVSILGIFQAESVRALIFESFNRFLRSPFVILLMVVFLSFSIHIIVRNYSNSYELSKVQLKNKSIIFICILLIWGCLLSLFPEFFYLRDQFGWRMNTIFKFYFQIWILFSLVAAFFVNELFFQSKSVLKKSIAFLITLIAMGTGLIYPVYAISEKTNGFKNIEWSLDGNKYFELINPAEFKAINYLKTVQYGIVAEAVGGSYTGYGRISKFTGFPTILGWPGHESQWRGGQAEIGNRESDVKELFITSNWDYAKTIINKYNIRYIYIGPLERSTYPVNEDKFRNNLTKIFDEDNVIIYEFRQDL